MNLNNFRRYLDGTDSKMCKLLSDSLMLASAVSIGAVTISLTALGVMVSDKNKKITMDFIVAPISRYVLVASYFLSSFAICLIVSSCFILLGGFYLLIAYGFFFSFLQIVYILLATILALIFGNALMIFVISFLKKETALGGLGAIIGTLIGFISGAYVPVSMFSEGFVQNFILCLPFAQLTAILKTAFLYDINSIAGVPEISFKTFLTNNGAEIYLWETRLSLGYLILIISAFIVIFAGLSILRYKRLKNK